MKITLLNLVNILFIIFKISVANNEKINIVGLFNPENYQAEIPFRSIVYTNNLVDQKVWLNPIVQKVSRNDNFAVTRDVCNASENGNGIAGVFGPQHPSTMAMIRATLSNLEIPHIQTSFYPHVVQNSQTTVNLYPAVHLLQKGIAKIIESLHWSNFFVIYEDEDSLIRLQDVLKMQSYEEEKGNSIILKQLAADIDHRLLLKEIKSSNIRRVVIDCRVDNLYRIFQQASELGLMGEFNSYILLNLDAHTIDYSKIGGNANITSIRILDFENSQFVQAVRNWEVTELHSGSEITLDPYQVKTETALMHDGLKLFIDALSALSYTDEISTKPISCGSSEKWSHGYQIISYMKIKEPSVSLSGPMAFDDIGRRVDFSLHLIEGYKGKILVTWNAKSPKILTRSETQGEQLKKIEENLQKTTVLVSSRIGSPYLTRRKPRYEGEELQGNARYEGYSMDLIAEIANVLNFTFKFHVVEDNQYGSYNPETKEWNGLIKDILDQRAHLALCDLSITHQRREAVDFSMPFMTLGISILYKKAEKGDINMFAFLDPFGIDVWLYSATLYLIITIVLYFISRLAPEDWENPHPCNDDPEELENLWDIKNCLWLTLGSIMAQGCDILPKGTSSRMSASMWWFFSLIMTSSYTANLAAFLTTSRMGPTIESVEDLAKQTKIKYGCLEGGATESFFRDSKFPLYQKMWSNMIESKPSVFQKNNDAGVSRVQSTKNALYAFLMESTQIEYVTETKCDLKQVGDWLDSKRYGIAMPLNAPYRTLIDNTVLKLQEDGKLLALKNKWWKEMRDEPSCENDGEEFSDALALANVGGVFLVLGIGVTVAYFIALLEFLWNVRTIAVEEHMSFWDCLKIELKFIVNIWITKKRTKSDESEHSDTEKDNEDNKSATQRFLKDAESFLSLNNATENVLH